MFVDECCMVLFVNLWSIISQNYQPVDQSSVINIWVGSTVYDDKLVLDGILKNIIFDFSRGFLNVKQNYFYIMCTFLNKIKLIWLPISFFILKLK